MKISMPLLLLSIVGLFSFALSHTSLKSGPLKYLEFLDFTISNLLNSGKIELSISNFNTTFYMFLQKSTSIYQPRGSNSSLNSLLYKSLPSFDLYKGVISDEREVIKTVKEANQFTESIPMLNSGWASILISGSSYLQGSFTFENVEYHIGPIDNYKNLKHYKDVDVPEISERKIVDKHKKFIIYREIDTYDSQPKKDFLMLSKRAPNLGRRNVVDNNICRIKKQELYIGVVADCGYMKKLASKDTAIKKIFSDWNKVSQIYEQTFNLQVSIVSLETFEECNSTEMTWNKRCENGYDLENKLEDFAKWVHKKDEDVGLWHLMTDCFINGVAGIANDGFCKTNYSAERNLNVGASSVSKDPWKTIAHELGHNLGAKHDCDHDLCSTLLKKDCIPCGDDCDCKGSYIMSPVATSDQEDHFSPGTIRTICDNLISRNSCFKQLKKRRLLKPGLCGNKIVEKGEECDCGSEEECKQNKCCNSNCKFKKGAQCDDTNDECCKNCAVKPQGETCRPSDGECDVEERCNGISGKCPQDTFVDNGTPCEVDTNQNLKCANGVCTSMDKQCQSLNSRIEMKGAFDKKNTLFNTCELLCIDHNDTPCRFQGTFIDGTQCGKNLYCKDGNCVGSFYDKIIDVIERNLVLSIVILIGIGVILLFTMLSFFQFVLGKLRLSRTKGKPTQ